MRTATIAGILVGYYRDSVIGGPGAFVVVVKDYNGFADAIIAEPSLRGDRPSFLRPDPKSSCRGAPHSLDKGAPASIGI